MDYIFFCADTLVCNYDIRGIRLLNIDVKYNVNQVAKTMAWSGNSLVRETPSDKKSDGDGGSGEAGTGEADDEESEESKAADDAVRQKMIDKYLPIIQNYRAYIR